MPTGRYPYDVVVAPDGRVFVSAWGNHVINVFPQNKRVDVSRHPASMLLNGDQLYVASASTDRIDVIDTKTLTVTKHIDDRVPGVAEGSTPNALAISGQRLYVAEADNNAVAQIDLKTDSVIGRIPVGWYPTALVAGDGDTLYVANGKGRGSRPNPATGYKVSAKDSDPRGYTLGQLAGTLTIVPGQADYGSRVAHANGWKERTAPVSYPQFERDGQMPALEIMTLPNDHTAGATPRAPTPRAYMADNDWALGRMIDALSHSRYWKSTAVFVIEDDAQDGADHVDSHRAPFLVISPWTRGGLVHRFVTTTDVIRTIEEILKLSSMSQFDAYGRPLREIWRTTPDTTPYVAHASNVDLAEHNPDTGKVARISRTLDFRVADAADPRVLNHVLWATIKGANVPYPVVLSNHDLPQCRGHGPAAAANGGCAGRVQREARGAVDHHD